LAFARDQLARTRRRFEPVARHDGPNWAAAGELAEIAGVLSEVEEGARRIRDIARDLNTFARDDEELRPVDLRTIADSALRMAGPEVRQRARVVRQYSDVPPVQGSPSRLSQVLLNLILNAAQSISPGAYDANEVAVRIRQVDQNVVVEVADTGCGIAPEHRERLFTPFFTTKPVGQGTGLGLSICAKIVRSLGGTIEVESEPGRGTVMRVVLPSVVRSVAGSTSRPPAAAARGRLLFIDDERFIGNAFQRALSRDHEVVVVQSAVDALTRLTGGDVYDLILCDVNMPVMTGVEFYERVAATWPELAPRIVMITGGGEHRTRVFAASRDVPLLEKPLDIDQVKMLLAESLEKPEKAEKPERPDGVRLAADPPGGADKPLEKGGALA
ncbi:MAG: hybrid sensor histidine kinase/response regulator, partial [Myxococcales bacterium]|nr:hybrid sensor histidine kinase/response regulator [Myxococcales bacterium]